MSDLIQYLRQKFPNLDKYDYSDEEVSLWYADQTGQDRQKVGELLGVYDPNQGNFMRGIDSAIDSTQALAYGAGALVADTVGAEGVRDSAIRGYQKNMAQVAQRSRPTDTVEGVKSVGDALDFATYYSGYGLAQGAQALATGGIGSLVGKQIVKQGIKRQGKDLLETEASKQAIKKAGTIGGYTGIGGQAQVTGLGSAYGGAVEKTLEEGGSIDDIDTARVYGYGSLAGAAEGIADVTTLGLAKFGPAKNLLNTKSKSRLRGAATRGAQGAAVEGVTEGVQTGLEDLGAGYSAEEARFFDPTAVAAGAIGGGQLGVVGGILTPPRINETEDSQTDLNKIKEDAKDEVGEQLGLDLDDPNSVEQYKADQERQARQAEQEAKREDDQRKAENELLREEAKEFKFAEFKKQIASGLEQTIDDKTSDLGKEFLELINTPTDTRPRGLIKEEDIKAARTQFVKDKTRTDEELEIPYNEELQRRVSAKAKALEGQIELDFNQETQEEKRQKALEMPVRNRATGVAKAKALFGEDFINNDAYADLASVVNAKNFNVKKFNTELDKIVSPTPPVAETTTAQPQAVATTTTEQPVNELTTPDTKKVTKIRGLTKDQQKINDVLVDHFVGEKRFDIDQVWAGGKFQPTKIAELAGVKSKQAVSTTINRFKTKFLEDQGQLPKNATKAQKDAAIAKFANSLAAQAQAQRTSTLQSEQTTDELVDNEDVVDQRPDADEVTDDDTADNSIFQQPGMGTVASVGQGNFSVTDAKGRTSTLAPEDVEYTKARSNEPDQYENKRQELADKERAKQNKKMIETYGQEAVAEWKKLTSDKEGKGIDIKELSRKDFLEWITIVEENRVGEISNAQMKQELREIELRYDPSIKQEGINEVQTTGPIESAEGRNTTKQSRTEDNRETQPKENKPKNETKLGVTPEGIKPTTRSAIETQIKKLTGERSNVRIHVFDTEADAITAINNGTVPAANVEKIRRNKPFGFVTNDNEGNPHAHFIADRIPEGGELAAFMHEVGGHIGIDSIIEPSQQLELGLKIQEWADLRDDSTESVISRRAMARVNFANKDGTLTDDQIISEAIAYFLEEASLAGIEPSVDSSIGQFLTRLRDLFIAALDKLGVTTADLTAQEVIDMAYGAARIELMHGQTPTRVQSPFTSVSLASDTNLGIIPSREWVGENLGGQKAVSFYDNAAEIGRVGARSVKFLHNIVHENRETMPALQRWYDGMLKVEDTRNMIKRMTDPIIKAARAISTERRAVVNKFLGDSTFEQKWGYDPKEYHPELFADVNVEIDSVKQRQFNELSDSEKQFVADVFAHGERMRQKMKAIEKKLGVDKFFAGTGLKGPYAPLKRFGNYVGELKSARYKQAERDAAVPGASKKKKDLLEELKSNPDHYVISFFDTPAAANQFVEANKAKYPFSPPSTERTPTLDRERVSNSEALEKVLGVLGASDSSTLDPNAKTAFRNMVTQLYLETLDDRDARASGARRLNRAGYEPNMIRSFVSHSKAQATMIAQVEHGAEINTAFREAQNSVKQDGDRVPEKQRTFVAVARHYNNMLTRKETPIQDRITIMNSVYMLLTSIGYHLTNATQPAMVSVPRIAGDFGDYTGAWSSLFRGYKQARAAVKIGPNLELTIDLDKVSPEYKQFLQTMQNRNLLDQGMEEDGSFDRFNTGYETLNRASDVLGTITSKLYNVAKFVEAQNRVSSAIAAYDVARAKPTKLATMKMTPEQYAIAVVEDTQGDFSQLDAPLLIKALPKVMTQYRKYQLLMAWHYTDAFNQGFRGETPEVRSAGKRVLGYSLAHAVIGAGATGVPLASTAFWLSTFLGIGDDEPMDMERWIKENIDDGMFGTALSRGLFTTVGIDLSTKLNQSKIFAPLPYAEFKTGEEGAKDIIMGLVGPAGTTGVNFFRAAQFYGQGDFIKGIEMSLPKGIRSVAESYRLATEGYTTRAGTIIVDPREIDAKSLLINAMGIPSTEINRIKWTRGQQFEIEQYFSKESAQIRKEYIEANRARNREKMRELRDEFRELQKSKDRVRPFFNDVPGVLRRQSVSTLIKAPRERLKRERKEQLKLAD